MNNNGGISMNLLVEYENQVYDILGAEFVDHISHTEHIDHSETVSNED